MKTEEKLISDLSKKASHTVEKLKKHQIKTLVPNEKQCVDSDSITLDYSRQFINQEVINALTSIIGVKNLKEKVANLFSGREMALHTVFREGREGGLRDNGFTIEMDQQIIKMHEFCDNLENGEIRGWKNSRIKNVIFIGLGGSIIPQKLVHKALRNEYQSSTLEFGFFSNPDGVELCDHLAKCDAESTFFVIQSKSFETPELFFLFDCSKKWLLAHGCEEKILLSHFAVVTSNRKKAIETGFLKELILEIPDKVGGRFSIWSAMGVSLALLIGKANFGKFLLGAKNMDRHFSEMEACQNLPMIMALISIWNRSFLNFPTQLVVNYSSVLDNLVPYLQQVEMESLGKSIGKANSRVAYATSSVIWGGSGYDGQHAYFQLLHQGTDIVPTDFFEVLQNSSKKHLPTVSLYTKENVRAQANALAVGSPREGFDGNRPSSIISLKRISPFSLGELMAMIEHKVFTQSIFWNINCFDQPGVELGKQLLFTKTKNISGKR